MRSEEIRTRFLSFFKKRGHAIIPSASLVPENDPTTLFTGSGMQPLLPYLLGEKHPYGTRLVNSQKSFRAEDIEEVGDNRHTTFFEMLGNWSLGDYFKKEQLRWFFEFLTEEVGLSPDRLYVTAFIGNEKAAVIKDTESASIWKQLFNEKGVDAKEVEIGSESDGYSKGMQGGRIFFYDDKKNWWNRGKPSLETTPIGDPAGPDSEVFYDFRTPHNEKFGKECHPNCDCGRFMEIGNSVFMEYKKEADGSFSPLKQKNVDFGGGLERIAAARVDNNDIFLVNHGYIIKAIEKETKTYYQDNLKAYRIIADHIKAAVFLIGDGVLPSNKDQGYFVRRLIRRALIYFNQLAPLSEKRKGKTRITSGTAIASTVVQGIVQEYKNQYSNLKEKEIEIWQIMTEEETRFVATLIDGLREFNRISSDIDISGKDAFFLFSTYGFPIEMTVELANEKNIKVDTIGFAEEMQKHQELSRKGAEKKFKGGLAGHSDKEVQYHTATHLLHQTLRTVLGNHVFQKGSNITEERLRFDFSHPKKMTEEEKKQVENIVNEKIKEALPVSWEEMTAEEAKQKGAIGLFDDQYGERVKVYQVGNEDTGIFSLEFCGGPHVKNTSELAGTFKIQKEEAVSQGVRRIKAVLE